MEWERGGDTRAEGWSGRGEERRHEDEWERGTKELSFLSPGTGRILLKVGVETREDVWSFWVSV